MFCCFVVESDLFVLFHVSIPLTFEHLFACFNVSCCLKLFTSQFLVEFFLGEVLNFIGPIALFKINKLWDSSVLLLSETDYGLDK